MKKFATDAGRESLKHMIWIAVQGMLQTLTQEQDACLPGDRLGMHHPKHLQARLQRLGADVQVTEHDPLVDRVKGRVLGGVQGQIQGGKHFAAIFRACTGWLRLRAW